MKTYLNTFWLSIKRSKLILILFVFTSYILIPAISVLTYRTFGIKRCLESMSYASHTLIPICSVLWGLVFLQIWVDNDWQEALRACSRGRYICGINVVLSTVVIIIILLPAFFVAAEMVGYSTADFIKLSIEVQFCMTILYVISLLTRSVTVGVIVVTAYLLFCVLFSGNSTFAAFCIIKNGYIASAADIINTYLPMSFICSAIWILSAMFERFLYRKY